MKAKSTIIMLAALMCGCKTSFGEQQSSSGIKRAEIPALNTIDGFSVEQHDIAKRLQRDNDPNSIKWIYCFGHTGQPVFTSTVRGKVTSGGKRLEPSTVHVGNEGGSHVYGAAVSVGGQTYLTQEIMQADGTYGASNPYIYWFDEADNYFQWSGPYLVSSVPVRLQTPILNLRDIDQEELNYGKQVETELKKSQGEPQ